MTAVTAARGRFIKRNAAGHEVTGTESRANRLADLDNVTSAPRIVLNDIQAATPDDLPFGYGISFTGELDELLEIQVNPDATLITDQADSTVLLQVDVAIKKKGGGWDYTSRDLTASDRVTPNGANSTRSNPNGLADGGTLQANAWGPYMRFAPSPNEVWFLRGHQHYDVHNST